jgi:hypothetical protein
MIAKSYHTLLAKYEEESNKNPAKVSSHEAVLFEIMIIQLNPE